MVPNCSLVHQRKNVPYSCHNFGTYTSTTCAFGSSCQEFSTIWAYECTTLQPKSQLIVVK
ncbi:uncharacterized protein PHALS_15208 [Plasmopara halstedii]|uniref:Uncharacterized protein n=1 Tax=Plasmopara halstedii TaxID=4781 RepID=A0A0P1B569_PLAHL|nr:uncharacterized protein PHALS_15208 [Plasmopara halstedii]CEG49301.1 hypothetical protein PHALS_15208 [Plasmopara halstedii]|eukprot:XP_024585670.1 hypothetical protein PHALS_15208 [Plasmopara halstedii]